MNDSQNPNSDLNIELTDEIAEGIFTNLALINHAPTEFVVDFIQVMPGMPKAKVRSRVILTPQHAKRLLQALHDNIAKYEQHFGSIKDQDTPNIPLNFGNVGEA